MSLFYKCVKHKYAYVFLTNFTIKIINIHFKNNKQPFYNFSKINNLQIPK